QKLHVFRNREVTAGRQHRALGEAKADSASNLPSVQIDRRTAAVIKFDVFFIAIPRNRVVHDFIDHNARQQRTAIGRIRRGQTQSVKSWAAIRESPDGNIVRLWPELEGIDHARLFRAPQNDSFATGTQAKVQGIGIETQKTERRNFGAGSYLEFVCVDAV